MRTAPYILLVLTIAILVAVAPLCVTTVAGCPSCVEFGSSADDHGVSGVAKRPVLLASPAIICSAVHPAGWQLGTAAVRDIRREAPPAPAARLRV